MGLELVRRRFGVRFLAGRSVASVAALLETLAALAADAAAAAEAVAEVGDDEGGRSLRFRLGVAVRTIVALVSFRLALADLGLKKMSGDGVEKCLQNEEMVAPQNPEDRFCFGAKDATPRPRSARRRSSRRSMRSRRLFSRGSQSE